MNSVLVERFAPPPARVELSKEQQLQDEIVYYTQEINDMCHERDQLVIQITKAACRREQLCEEKDTLKRVENMKAAPSMEELGDLEFDIQQLQYDMQETQDPWLAAHVEDELRFLMRAALSINRIAGWQIVAP